MANQSLADRQSAYYNKLLGKHGLTVEAMACTNWILESLRYKKSSNVFHRDTEPTLHDIGFGLGHYYEFLQKQFPENKIHLFGS